jgi:eukaryotic-like serine/threonine-protein kinase
MIGGSIGSYQILRELGAGGMGTVYLAQHQVIGRLAAIKLLLPALSMNEEMVARMFNEARATALIRHPGLVDVYDFGRLADGRAFIVMEYLDGESLAARLARGRLPAELACVLARQVAAAVGAAHATGIVHRDLKPDNIYIVADDEIDAGVRARVLDFGIAKLSDVLAGGGHHTRTGSLLGTPAYMSPEQCRGAGAVDARTDVYSLGCILFEMLTGRRPFAFEGLGEIIVAHLHEPPPVASRIEPSVPAWLDPVLARLLAKDPAARYPSMEEVALALGGRTRGRPSLPSGGIGVARVPVPTTLGQTAGQRGAPSIVARRPRLSALVVAGVLGMAGAVAALALRGREDAPPAAAARPEPPAPAPSRPPPPPPPVVEPRPAAPPPAVAPPPPPPRQVVLKIRSAPAGAAVFLASGEKAGVTPLDYTVVAAPGEVSFDLRLPGYRGKRVSLRGDEDGEQAVRLTATPAATRGKPARETVDPF